MTIQAFVDESGGKGDGGGPHFVMAAVIQQADIWGAFSDQWDYCIRETPAIVPFKFSRIDKWSNVEARNEKLRKLAAIINANVCSHIWVAVNLPGHAKTMGKRPNPFKDAYFLGFYSMIFAVCQELWESGLRDRFELIFDQHHIFAPRVRRWYPVVADMIQKIAGESFSILPVDVMFKPDDEFLPLQAADFYAALYRLGNLPEMEYDWLGPLLRNVKKSKHCTYWTEQHMRDAPRVGTEAIRRSKLFTPEIVDRYKEIAGVRNGKKKK